MKLADICEINPRAEVLDDNTLVSFVAMPDVSEDGKINVDTYRAYGEVKKGFTNFKEGDVLFAKITPCMENGKGALATGLENGLGFGSTEFHVLRPNAAIVLGEWLYYLTSWSAFRKDAEKHMTGSAGQKRVPKSFLEKYEVDVPPIDDQEYQVLQLNRIRKIIDARRQQLSALDDLIKARFVEMFGDPVSNPKGWVKKALSDEAEIRIGPFGSLLHKEDYVSGGHALVNPSHIINGQIVPDNELTVSDTKYTELSPYHLIPGDVVMGRRGEMGRCAVVEETGLLCGTGSLLIRTNGELSADFIQKIISFPSFKRTIEDMAVGQTMPNLNVPIVSSFEIIKPPKSVQEQYYAFVAQIDKSKSVIQKSLDETQLLFDSLMQKYFG